MAAERRERVESVCSRRYSRNMASLSTFLRTAVLCVILRTSFVTGDITDGNQEHLKREHSLMKPYHGKMEDALRCEACDHVLIVVYFF